MTLHILKSEDSVRRPRPSLSARITEDPYHTLHTLTNMQTRMRKPITKIRIDTKIQEQTLPIRIGTMTKVKDLNLKRCHLNRIPDSIRHLPHLQTLDLRNNELTTLPESLRNLTALTDFSYSENPFVRPFSRELEDFLKTFE